MRAIVIKRPGGPEVLAIEERPMPQPAQGQILIAVKAFGLNHAELYFRSGQWADAAEISGIECVGEVYCDPSGRLQPGQTVAAVVGGMGRSLNGSYAEFVAVPATNVAPIRTDLSWEALAAIPESFVSAWTALNSVLAVKRGDTVLIRGASSALGQAAINIAAQAGVKVLATVRRMRWEGWLRRLGAAAVFRETPSLAPRLLEISPRGVDAVLDIVGTATVLDSLAATRKGGAVCLVGFLGGLDPLTIQPVFQIPSGRSLQVFASAMAIGTADFPLHEVPLQTVVERVASGAYQATPSTVFNFEDIVEAHRLMDSGRAGGKVVVRI